MPMATADDHLSLGPLVRQRRRALGLSQEELAERASDDHDQVRQSDISRLERGQVGLPRRARLLRLAAALDLPPGDLLARSGWASTDRDRPAGGVGAGPATAGTIVVADDEAIVAEALATALAAEGAAVVTALRLAELMARLEQARPALVLADANWPTDGLRRLNQQLQAETPPVPLLLVGDPPAASALAAVPVLRRLVVLTELRAAVARLREGDVHQAKEVTEIERFA